MSKNSSDRFLGILVSNKDEKSFRKEELQRKKDYFIKKGVPKSNVNQYLKRGYEKYKEYKGSCWLRKKKDFSDLFEDEIWLLFKKMGFEELNEGYGFKINVAPKGESRKKTKQIDVFAKDGKDIFVVECKAKETPGSKSLRKDIADVKDNRISIERAIKEHYGERKRVTFIFCTRNIEWSGNDESDAKGANIIIWREKEISYFKRLGELIGSSAKYQLFAIIHEGEKAIEIPAIPALKGEMGGKTYYTFMIQPEKLLKIAYVHHRSPIHLERGYEINEGNAYQRMLNKPKLRSIDNFITKGGYFANNVIVNFTKEPTFVMRNKVEEIETGFLKLPQYYASARIIDGQHRLYGFADNPEKIKEMIPVLAFENLPKEEEGKLFVDINKEQKTVEPNLLWDLYDDIYEDSLDDKNQMLRVISRIIKNLNNREKSPFHDRIYIPSLNERKDRLTMATIGNGIKKTGLVKRKGLLFGDDWKTTENFATNRLESFFKIVSSLLSEDWKKGEKGFLCSNNGVAVSMRIFKEVIRYLSYRDPTIIKKVNLSEFENKVRELINPAINHLREIGEGGRNELRRQTSQEGMRDKIADDLMYKIKKYYLDFAPDLPPSQEDKAKKLIEETELHLRKLIKSNLEGKYGDKWWKQGIPDGVKKYVKERLDEKIKKAPWKKDEIEKDLEQRIELTTIGHLKDIILSSNNWELFESKFRNKKETENNFEGFGDYRNGIDHLREFPDEIVKKKNFLSMRWIRKCLGLE